MQHSTALWGLLFFSLAGQPRGFIMSHSKMARRGHYASRSQGEWFALCSEYDRRSNLKESREQFCVRVGISASSFAGNYRKFKAGGLDQGSDMKRQRQRKFEVAATWDATEPPCK